MNDREGLVCHLFVQATALLLTRTLGFGWRLLAAPPGRSLHGLYSQDSASSCTSRFLKRMLIGELLVMVGP